MKKELGYVLSGFLLCLLITKQPFFNEKESIKNNPTENTKKSALSDAISSIGLEKNELKIAPSPTQFSQDLVIQGNKDDLTPEEVNITTLENTYLATPIQLAKINDDLDWITHFQGNSSVVATEKTQFLTSIFDLYTHDIGYFYDAGCNKEYCAVLAQNFNNEAQAQSTLEKITNNHQLGSFIYTKVSKVPDGYNLRLSVPIQQDIKLEANLFEAFKQL
ncbi:hypothetical protein PULV_b0030 [Pseudoalteromonas ulvae UL12]|uniref:hypothetical protein n=1 Tax=Pseudoalteromonas ulvae TaxID=107327 RepID=UPI00186BADC1|nr:hypothetical protein [Pseudoalteromonas ulvae]MBE0365457.1 hypothetical protein [Pseudoalteromonas ulvae UL12]